MLVYSTADSVECRTAIVPACERDLATGQGADIEALGVFQIRLRDELDFKVDFSQWLKANGGGVLSDALFEMAADSPSAPTIGGQAFNAAGKCLVVISPGEGAKVGDAYWLDVTATVAPVAAVSPADTTIPERVLTRRIHVVVANG